MRIVRDTLTPAWWRREQAVIDFSRPGRTWLPTLGQTRFPLWKLVAAPGSSPARSSATSPGQAISYKVGERAWLAGREAARTARGDAFDLKSWHMSALSLGAIGLDDLTTELAHL